MGVGLFSNLKTHFFSDLCQAIHFSFLLSLHSTSCPTKACVQPETALTLQVVALVVFTVVYVSAGLGVQALCQLHPLPFSERLRVDTASDTNLSQMMPSLRNPRRQLCADRSPLATL